MDMEHRCREFLPDVRRVVIKIGSRVIVQKTGRPDTARIRNLAGQIARLRRRGYEVLVVSSGAISAGMEALRLAERPRSVPELQMCAAVGQTRLMGMYATAFEKMDFRVGQILMTHADFQHRIRLANARRTIEHLLRANIIPVINENDVVADEEIRAEQTLGDNDSLAALVVKLTRADLLVLLTTVDGLRRAGKNGRTHRVRFVETISKEVFALIQPDVNPLSKGGMASKLRALQKITRTGCCGVIANGRTPNVLLDLMQGKNVGTLVPGAST